jgi:hypothetical protein
MRACFLVRPKKRREFQNVSAFQIDKIMKNCRVYFLFRSIIFQNYKKCFRKRKNEETPGEVKQKKI